MKADTLIGSFNDFLFTETSTAPAQVNVEEGKSGKEEPSSTLVTFCHPDSTTNINAGTLFWMIK